MNERDELAMYPISEALGLMAITKALYEATNEALQLPIKQYDTRESENVQLQLELLLEALSLRGIVPGQAK